MSRLIHARNVPPRACARARAELKAYLDGELSGVRGLLTRGHLRRCAACREESAWLRRLGEDMKDLERAVPAPALRSRILAALPEASPASLAGRPAPVMPRYRPAPNRAVPRFALGGAFAAAGLAVFALSLPRTPVPEPTPETVAATTRPPASPAPVFVQVAPVIPPPAAPDPLSEEADREVARLEARRAGQERRDRDAELRRALALAARRPRLGAPDVRLTLALSGLTPSAASDRLGLLARRLGGRADAVSPETGQAATGPADSAPRPAAVIVRVPSVRSAAFADGLKRLGQVFSLPTGGDPDPARIAFAAAPSVPLPTAERIPAQATEAAENSALPQVANLKPLPARQPDATASRVVKVLIYLQPSGGF